MIINPDRQLDDEKNTEQQTQCEQANKQTAHIEFRNVKTSRGAENLLNNFSLEIPKNSKIVIVATNPEETNSAVSLLAGMQAPDEGEIVFDGTETTKNGITRNLLRRNVFVSFDDPLIVKGNILTNISLGSQITDTELLQEAMEKVGLSNLLANDITKLESDLRNLNPETYIKRQIEIARAIIRNSQIMVFQEPTKNLNSEQTTKIVETLITATNNKTAIFFTATDHLNEHADFIYTLKDGKLESNKQPTTVQQIENQEPNPTIQTSEKIPNFKIDKYIKKPIPALEIVEHETGQSIEYQSELHELKPGDRITEDLTLTKLAYRDDKTHVWFAWSNKLIAPTRIMFNAQKNEEKISKKLIEEYQLLHNWKNINITKGITEGTYNEHTFTVLEFINSRSLAGQLTEQKPNIFDVLCVGTDIGSALDYIHQKGYGFAILTPAYIAKREKLWLLTRYPKTIKLDEPLNDKSLIKRSKTYLAPELNKNNTATVNNDVYTLGKIMAKMLHNSKPNEVYIPYELRSATELDEIIGKMTNPDIRKRPTLEAVTESCKSQLNNINKGSENKQTNPVMS